MPTKFVGNDFIDLHKDPDGRSAVVAAMAFGDAVEILDEQDGWLKLRALTVFDGDTEGWADNSPPLSLRDEGIVKFSMVDVQQGDGMVLETPSGRIVLIDGGDNKLFARHVAARFLHLRPTPDTPLPVEAIVITHGDADHFDGLNDFLRSETEPGIDTRKRVRLQPKRIYHNGLVKLPGTRPDGRTRPDLEMFGETADKDGIPHAVDLVDDPTELPDERMNLPFRRWVNTVRTWAARAPIDIRRIAFGDDADEVFDFLHDEDLRVEIQGPFPADVNGRPGLRFFRAPSRHAELHLRSDEGSYSDSHTVNGHSIALRITYGAVRFNLSGDLNRPAMQLALKELDAGDFEAEIVKAPHHGSGDFDFAALRATRPVVAIVSSGDESAAKEHIHPRATLMAALGKVMRGDTGIIFNTELAAFFTTRDYAHRREDLRRYFSGRGNEAFTGDEVASLFSGRVDPGDPQPSYFSFERTNFGIIHIRTDGHRVLAFTHSGKKGVNEAYAFTVTMEADGSRTVAFLPEVDAR
ncbi:MAG TPA: MBL fold metallo-hydrolase [Woeseiaceae bacterium]|nr:MBL fold metallo-hydrolase [Woeseiaceae bacterium]